MEYRSFFPPWIYIETRNYHSPKPQTLKSSCPNTVKSRSAHRGKCVSMQTSWLCFAGRKAETLWDMSQNWKLYPKIPGLEYWDLDLDSPEAWLGPRWLLGVKHGAVFPQQRKPLVWWETLRWWIQMDAVACPRPFPQTLPTLPSHKVLNPSQKWVKRKPPQELCIDAAKREKGT